MQMVQSQFEIDHISKSVGLAFKFFDFVVDFFHKSERDLKKLIVQESMAIVHECLGNRFELLDA